MAQRGIPLRDNDLLLIKGPNTFDLVELTRVLEPLGFGAFLTTRFEIMVHEFKKTFIKEGVSYIWRLVHVQESVLPPGPEKRIGLLELLDGMISNLAPNRDFTIVDPFLLPLNEKSTTFLPELIKTLDLIAKSVKKLLLITSDNYDNQLLITLKKSLEQSCPGCEVVHKVSKHFHDRFWIADQTRGLYVGTSFNGIGRRYAIADYLEGSDVTQIVSDLKNYGLL